MRKSEHDVKGTGSPEKTGAGPGCQLQLNTRIVVTPRCSSELLACHDDLTLGGEHQAFVIDVWLQCRAALCQRCRTLSSDSTVNRGNEQHLYSNKARG